MNEESINNCALALTHRLAVATAGWELAPSLFRATANKKTVRDEGLFMSLVVH